MVSFLIWVCVAALLVMLVASLLDPRIAVAAIMVSLPVVAYQVGILVLVEPVATWPVALTIGAFATNAVVAVRSTISLRRRAA